MIRVPSQRGHVLFAVILFLVFLALGLSAIGDSMALKAQFDQHRERHDQQALVHAKQSLLSYAAAQGFHAQSHLGNLPCPALLSDSNPQTSCNNKPWGFLPMRSNAKVNFLQPGVASTQAMNPPQQQRAWQYAVSQQVIQPNKLGWSRWVDWSAPAMTVQIEGASPHTLQGVAVVVSQGIQPLSDHTYQVQPPYMVIFSHELRLYIEHVERITLEHSLMGWLHNDPNPAQARQWHHENLLATTQPDMFQPNDSACACRCTKTRCTCQCAQAGQWLSNSPCEGSPEMCTRQPEGQYACTSGPSQPCVFKGAAQLQSHWPVSHFDPPPAAHRACRPSSMNICPLSDQTQACECTFSWPEQTLHGLTEHRVQYQGRHIKVIRGGP